MKFRLLTLEELEELEPEFVQFLASNSITAPDWVELKEKDPKKVDKLIEIFSDIVMEKVLKKVKYVERREQKNVLLFYFQKDMVALSGLSVTGDEDIDFTNPSCVSDLAKRTEGFSKNFQIFKSEKLYQKSREEEIFEVIESGGLVSDGKLFNLINTLKK